jgi:hypothetical protein
MSASRIDRILDDGFDRSTVDGKGCIDVRCSQCQALVINGTPAHEHGCPNARRRRRFEDDDDCEE